MFAMAMLMTATRAAAQTETVLYSFNGTDGRYPAASLISDAAGNLYGTTPIGGTGPCPNGCGTVFKVDNTGHETVLYTFCSSTVVGSPCLDGDNPTAGLLRDAAGNLYATWDTQTAAGDIGWLTWSRDGGRTWSAPVRVTPDHDQAPHIVESAAAAGLPRDVGLPRAARATPPTCARSPSPAAGWARRSRYPAPTARSGSGPGTPSASPCSPTGASR